MEEALPKEHYAKLVAALQKKYPQHSDMIYNFFFSKLDHTFAKKILRPSTIHEPQAKKEIALSRLVSLFDTIDFGKKEIYNDGRLITKEQLK